MLYCRLWHILSGEICCAANAKRVDIILTRREVDVSQATVEGGGEFVATDRLLFELEQWAWFRSPDLQVFFDICHRAVGTVRGCYVDRVVGGNAVLV